MPISVIEGNLSDTYLLTPIVHRDDRGSFMELFNEHVERFFPNGIKQISESSSYKGVLRGIHFQYDPPMSKMMRVVRGTAAIIQVDLRWDSPSYLHTEMEILDDVRKQLVYAPASFGRAFVALEDATHVEYWHDARHNPETSVTIDPFDRDIKINWAEINAMLCERTSKSHIPWIMSEKDRNGISVDQWHKNPKSMDLECD